MAERIGRDAWLMEMAFTTARRGTCSRAQVGAVVARHSRILSTGYNGVPAGQEHCDHSCDCNGEDALVYLGHSKNCNSQHSCKTAIHAEANAIAFAAKEGVSLEGSTIYTTYSPCQSCAGLIINSGIIRVVYGICYRDTSPISLMQSSGIQIDQRDKGNAR